MRRLALIFALLFAAAPSWAAVSYAGTASSCTSTSAGTSIPSCSFTLPGGTTNGAVAVSLTFVTTSITGVTVTVGGVSASLVASTDTGSSPPAGTRYRNMIYCAATGSATGAQTVSVSWTGSSNASAGMVGASGVDQATPCNNGTTSSTTSATISTSITSSSGDLTFDWVSDGSGSNGYPNTPTQTQRLQFQDGSFNAALGESTGPGTGTATHQWTVNTSSGALQSGANFKSAATFTTEQTHFRFRNDDGSESAATWLATEDTSVTQPLSTNTRLRMQVDTGGASGSQQYQLEYKKSTDGAYKAVLTAQPACIFQAVGTGVGGAANISPAWPTHQANDIGLLFIESAGGEAANLGTPAGFAAVTNSPQSTGAGTAGTRITVYWARATSSAMGAPTVTDPGNHAYGVILTFRGCYQGGDPWDVTAGGVKATASTSASAPAVTTTVANTLVINAISRDDDAAGAEFGTSVTWANANLGSLTEQSDAGTTSGNGGGIGIATGTKATAGDTTATTVGVTSSINAQMTIALKPQIEPILLSASGNIAASAATSTTAQLSVPNSHSFTALRISDDTNPLPAVTLADTNYGEAEWSMQAASPAANGDIYTFRLTEAGAALTTYSVTPQWTIGTAGAGVRKRVVVTGE
jgi:hypothetical protein